MTYDRVCHLYTQLGQLGVKVQRFSGFKLSTLKARINKNTVARWRKGAPN